MSKLFLKFLLIFILVISCSQRQQSDLVFLDNSKLALMGFFTQGGFALGKVRNAEKIFLNETEIDLSDEGLFFVGFEIEHPKVAKINVLFKDGNRLTEEFKITEREFPRQNINFRSSKKKKKPGQELLDRLKKEQAIKKHIKATKTDNLYYYNKWEEPTSGRITGVYGAARTYNNTNPSTHFGIDIAVRKGTEILAPTDGEVILADYFFYSGKLIFLDHGHGVLSAFLHLDELLVKPGDIVKKGDVIGLSGSTGRSTGPHLDWRVFWRGINLDPTLITSDNASYKSF